jgi:hypothetical protein
MASNILAAVRRIKSNVAEHLQAAAIERLCRELKYVWRDRLLGPVVTVHPSCCKCCTGIRPAIMCRTW